MTQPRKHTPIPAKPATKRPPNKPWMRQLALEHLPEISGLILGSLIIICATLAAIFKVMDSNALAVILGGAAGGGIGYGAGKTTR
jgi:hypothetical protein